MEKCVIKLNNIHVKQLTVLLLLHYLFILCLHCDEEYEIFHSWYLFDPSSAISNSSHIFIYNKVHSATFYHENSVKQLAWPARTPLCLNNPLHLLSFFSFLILILSHIFNYVSRPQHHKNVRHFACFLPLKSFEPLTITLNTQDEKNQRI